MYPKQGKSVADPSRPLSVRLSRALASLPALPAGLEKNRGSGAGSLAELTFFAPIYPFKFFAEIFSTREPANAVRGIAGVGVATTSRLRQAGRRSPPEPEGLLVRYCTALQNPPRVCKATRRGRKALCTTVCTTASAIVTKHALGGFSSKGKAR